MATPTRQTSERDLDRWNDAMRASPVYQQFLQQQGLTGRVGGWSRAQQAALENHLRANGIEIPDGMHIDQGGNLNQKNRLVRNAAIGAAATGAALTGFGLAGMGPLSGLAGGSAAAGGAGAASAAGGATPGLISGGVLPLGTGLTAAQMTTPALGSLLGATGAGVGAGLAGGAGTAAASAGVGGVANKILKQLAQPENIASLAALIPALSGSGMFGGGSRGPAANSPQLDSLIQMSVDRAKRTDPLHQMVTQLAESRMPINSRKVG